VRLVGDRETDTGNRLVQSRRDPKSDNGKLVEEYGAVGDAGEGDIKDFIG